MNKIWTFDTEDDGNALVYWINFYDGKKHYSFRDREDAIIFLINQKNRINLYAVNLEYDLINLFGQEFLVKETRLTYSKSRIIKCVFKKISFYDTLNNWHLGVYSMGEILKIRKLKFNPKSVAYCRKDCEIPYKYIMRMLEVYNSIDLDLQATAGSTAMKYYRKKYNKMYFKTLKIKQLEEFKKYYYGGRTEAFYIGEQIGTIHCVDINSLYPFCMLNDFPNPYQFQTVRKLNLNNFSLIDCLVKSDMTIPILPVRYNHRLVFPNGTFRVQTNSVELKAFIERGGEIVKTYKIIEFPYYFRPFDDYVTTLYAQRQQAANTFEDRTYKSLLVNLYGKFAQGRDRSVILDVKTYLRRRERGLKYTAQKPLFTDGFCEYLLATEIGNKFPRHTNYIFSLFCTAYARIELYKLLERVRNAGNNILYCDTDSCIYDGEFMDGSDDIGDLKEEFSSRRIIIHNLKEYAYGDSAFIYKCKGIEKSGNAVQRYFDTGKTAFKKPNRLRASLRATKAELTIANKWVMRERECKGEYLKGNVLTTGTVIPYTLSYTRGKGNYND